MSFKDIRNELTPEVNALLEDMVEFDEINKPMHYNTGKYETFDIIVDVMGDYETIPYCRGNVLKYMLHRMWNKGDPLANVQKATWYLDKQTGLMRKTEGVNW